MRLNLCVDNRMVCYQVALAVRILANIIEVVMCKIDLVICLCQPDDCELSLSGSVLSSWII